jgi:hypothetical protein
MAHACETARVGRSCVHGREIDVAVGDVLSNPEIAANATLAAAQLASMPAGTEVAA